MISAADKVYDRIVRWGYGSAFVARDFMRIVSRGSVGVALSTLMKEGHIRRVIHGVYDYPARREDGEFEKPDFHRVVRAYERRVQDKIRPDGAVSTYLVGISPKIPGEIVYITDGPKRCLNIKESPVYLRTAPEEEFFGDHRSHSVISALMHVGSQNVDEEVLSCLQQYLTRKAHRKTLLKNSKKAPDWIKDIVSDLCES